MSMTLGDSTPITVLLIRANQYVRIPVEECTADELARLAAEQDRLLTRFIPCRAHDQTHERLAFSCAPRTRFHAGRAAALRALAAHKGEARHAD